VSDEEVVTPLWTHEDAAIGERVGRSLRSETHLPPNFDAKVMSAVRVESRVRMRIASRRTPDGALDAIGDATGRGWWLRAQRVEITPLAAAAWLLGLALLVALGALAALRLMPRQQPPLDAATVEQAGSGLATAPIAATDTLHLVRFAYLDSTAARVTLVGDFNDWTRGTTELLRDSVTGLWSTSLPLAPGRYEYAFIVDDARRVIDPIAPRAYGDVKGERSLLVIR
jgi:hypothetical protein